MNLPTASCRLLLTSNIQNDFELIEDDINQVNERLVAMVVVLVAMVIGFGC